MKAEPQQADHHRQALGFGGANAQAGEKSARTAPILETAADALT